MVDIECTRCGATGNDYPTHYVAKFTLKHETGCGAKVGVPKYTNTGLKRDEGIDTKPTEEQTTVISEAKVSEKKKTKKKKKAVTIVTS